MKYLITILLLFPLIVSAQLPQEKNGVLQEVWRQRPDLQKEFPDGQHGDGWTLVEWAQMYGWKENPALLRYNPEAEKEHIYRKYIALERSLMDVAVYQYDEEARTCWWFSATLLDQLKWRGIMGSMVNGDYKDGKHIWVVVHFEAGNGKLIRDNWDYKPNKLW